MKQAGLGFFFFYIVLLLAATDAKTQSMIITGHRGAAGYAPENTIASVVQALKRGADRVEIDVQQTGDKRIVALHDRTIDRTTGSIGFVHDFTYQELAQFHANKGFQDEFPEARIPLLSDILDTIAHYNARLLIEVKEGSSVYPGIEKRIVDIIREKGMQERVILQSFRDEVLHNFIELGIDIALHKLMVFKVWGVPLIYDGKWRLKKLSDYPEVEGFNVHYKFARKALVQKIHRLGKEINVWTVNEKAVVKEMKQRGVDGIITDYPGKWQDILK